MNKNVYLFLMIFSFFFNGKVMGTAWDGISSDTKWYDEAKTEFQISSAAQLKGLADLVNNSGLTFEGKKIMLDNDIDLNNKLWTPIGNGNYANCDKVFKGVFDGCGHKISNVSIKNTTNPYGNIGLSNYYSIGFFGVVEEGLITRVRIDGEVTIEEGYGCGSAGGLVGYAINCTMEKICASFKLNVKVSTSDFYLGGVAGYAVTSSFFVVASSGEALFYNSVYMGPQSYFGGVAALAQSLKECSSDFKIVILTNVPTSSCHIGGLAGYAKSVSNAIFSGSIKIDDYWNRQNVFMGGVVGQAGSEISNVISAPLFFLFADQYACIISRNDCSEWRCGKFLNSQCLVFKRNNKQSWKQRYIYFGK